MASTFCRNTLTGSGVPTHLASEVPVHHPPPRPIPLRHSKILCSAGMAFPGQRLPPQQRASVSLGSTQEGVRHGHKRMERKCVLELGGYSNKNRQKKNEVNYQLLDWRGALIPLPELEIGNLGRRGAPGRTEQQAARLGHTTMAVCPPGVRPAGEHFENLSKEKGSFQLTRFFDPAAPH